MYYEKRLRYSHNAVQYYLTTGSDEDSEDSYDSQEEEHYEENDYYDEEEGEEDEEEGEEYVLVEETFPYGHDYSRHISRDEQFARTESMPQDKQMTYLERLWTTGTTRDYWKNMDKMKN